MSLDFDKLADEIRQSGIEDMTDEMILYAERAWKSDKKARRFIDVRDDASRGERSVKSVRGSIEKWIKELEEFANAAEEISRRVSKALYEGKSDLADEGHSERNEPDSREH